MMDLIWMAEVVNDVMGGLKKLGKEEFMCAVCMMFDEYHNAHRDCDAAEMAADVADLVKFVNDTEGEYVNVA